MGVQEYVLQQVLGILFRPGHPERQRIQPWRMRPIQLLERRHVAPPATLRQLRSGALTSPDLLDGGAADEGCRVIWDSGSRRLG